MPKKLKDCTVCGEKARGRNFCAISCQSCKAFFRRNAFKYEKYKCKSRNNCQIDGKSRRLCKKCRLKKCFAVGMKKEWILNEEEKESRRRQIEENRIKKFGDKRKTTNGSTICTLTPSPGVDPQETDSLLVVSQNEETSDYSEKDKYLDTLGMTLEMLNDSNNVSNIIDLNKHYSTNIGTYLLREPNCMSDVEIKELDSTDMSDTLSIYETNGETLSLDLYNSDHNLITNNELRNECEIAVKLITNHTMDKLNELNYFNPFESKRLGELFSLSWIKRITLFDDIKYTSSFDDSVIYTISVTTDELMERVATKFDTELQHLVGAIKQLGAFQSLRLNDQIAMIKYNCIELKIVQAVLYFCSKIEDWTFKIDNNLFLKLKLDSTNGFMYSFFALLKYYLNTFAKEFDCDLHIIQLLMPIILFNPERPNIIHKDVIEVQQQLYLYLIHKYLRMKYGFEGENKFSKISDILQDLQTLNELQKQNLRELKSELCGPLLKEILDLPL